MNPRTPAEIPDRVDVSGGLDTDGDLLPDTVLTRTSGELLVCTDLDGDGLADQILAIGPGGSVRIHAPGADPPDDIWLD